MNKVIHEINWKEYKRLLKREREHTLNPLFLYATSIMYKYNNLAYWARKDLEAFEEKEMLPRFNSKLFWIYRRAYQLTGR